MSLSIITKIVGFTIVAKSSDSTTRKRIEDFSKQLKLHEGHLLPELDQSADYEVYFGDQKQYYKRLTASNPTIMRFEFIQDLEKALKIERTDVSDPRISVGCSPNHGNCSKGTNKFIPAEHFISRYVKNNAMLCWHLDQRFSDQPENKQILATECRPITLAPKSR